MFIPGEANVVADAISCLPREEHANDDQALLHDDLCALLNVADLFVNDASDCFATTNVDAIIDFMLALELMEVE